MKLILADCLAEICKMKTKSVDLLLTDPPYGISIARGRTYLGSGGKVFSPKTWDSTIPDKDIFDEMLRVSKHQIIWGGNHFTAHLPASRCWLVWWKNDGLGLGHYADCELVWTSFQQPAQVFNSRWCGFVKDSKETQYAHPTQKALSQRRGKCATVLL